MAEDGAPPVTNVISGEAQPASQSEVLYVQGMSNPMNAGQYPQTQAVSYTHLTLPTSDLV